MCDYCGCREITEVAELGRQHEQLLDLADRVRRALGRDEQDVAERLFAELLTVLDHHVRIEEAGMFSALRASGELTRYIDELEAEHERMAAAVDGITLDSVPTVLDELAVHIRKEESDLFPALLLFLGAGAPAPG